MNRRSQEWAALMSMFAGAAQNPDLFGGPPRVARPVKTRTCFYCKRKYATKDEKVVPPYCSEECKKLGREKQRIEGKI